MPCRNPCRLYIAFHYSVGPSNVVWSELGPALPFPPMRVLEVYWSWALSLVCEVALREPLSFNCNYKWAPYIYTNRPLLKQEPHVLIRWLHMEVIYRVHMFIYNGIPKKKCGVLKTTSPRSSSAPANTTLNMILRASPPLGRKAGSRNTL